VGLQLRASRSGEARSVEGAERQERVLERAPLVKQWQGAVQGLDRKEILLHENLRQRTVAEGKPGPPGSSIVEKELARAAPGVDREHAGHPPRTCLEEKRGEGPFPKMPDEGPGLDRLSHPPKLIAPSSARPTVDVRSITPLLRTDGGRGASHK
jgi:hypothetical protein